MLTLRSSDDTHRVVAEQADGLWTARLECGHDALGWTAAELLSPRGWPLEREARRAWIPAAQATVEGSVLQVAGEGHVEGHRWRVCDEYRFAGATLCLTRRWTHAADEPQDGLDLLIEIPCPAPATPQFLLPGISYSGNPGADPGRLVPRFPEQRPARCLYEEHRFPVPMVTCEWDGAVGRSTVSLVAEPSRIGPPADDHWWSLGLALDQAGATLVVSSGTVETNDRRNAVYGSQCRLVEIDGWPVTAAPGATFQKRVFLESGLAEAKGHGFRQGLWRAHALFRPTARPAVSLERLIDLKLNCLRSRYAEDGDAAGFLCVPAKNAYRRGPYFQWGWVGQGLRGCWCALHEGRRRGKAYLERMAVRAADFFVDQPLPKPPHRVVALRYALDERRWVHRQLDGAEVVSSRQFGEAFTNLARLVELGRHLGLRVQAWLERLCWAADFLAEAARPVAGCLPQAWTVQGEPLPGLPSAAGAPCVSVLARAGLLTGTDRYRVAARELLVAYQRRFLADLSTPPWGSTLDARCEDKEAGLLLLAAALDAYESIGEGRFLDWARQAADWSLTFYYVWHAPFPPGKPCHGKLSTVGWPSVSVQNHHLDVFAMPSLFVRLAHATGESRYERFARVMLAATTQSVARKGAPWGFDRAGESQVVGEQGEAVFHTNYWQGPGDASLWRGDHNTWNPLWVCAVALQEAILCQEAGIRF